VVYADKVLANSKTEDRVKSDAQIIIARSAIKTNDEVKAKAAYAKLLTIAKGELAAEAMYYDAYFKNKEGLLIEVIQIMIDKYLLEVEERLKRGINAKERVSNFIKYFQETLSENPKLFRLLYDFSSMALWSDVFGKQLSNLFEKLSILVEEYIFIDTPEDSFLKNQSSNAIARILFGTMFGTAIQVLLDPKEKRLPESLSAIETLF